MLSAAHPHSAADHLLDKILFVLRNAMQGGSTSISRVDEGHVLVDEPKVKGENIFPCMKRLLLLARSEILLMGYRLDGGCDGEKDFIETLSELSRIAEQLGITIQAKILINRTTGLASMIEGTLNNAFRSGIKFKNINIQYVEHSHKAFGSYHTKMLVIDGVIAMMPSGELLQASNYKDGKSRQVDVASIFYGDFVNVLREEFRTAWNKDSCKPLSGTKSAIPARLEPAAAAPVLPAAIPARAVYIAKNENGNITNRSHMSPFAVALITAIREARHSINMLTPNLNTDAIIIALAEAHQRNIPIRLVMGKHMNDKTESMPLMGGTNRAGVQKLFDEIARRKGDPFKNINVRWATDDAGTLIIPHPHPNTVHARMVCIDGQLVIGGSSVCDNQSVFHSKEGDVIFASPQVADMYMRIVFMPIFSKAVNIFHDPELSIRACAAYAEPCKISLIYEISELIKHKHIALNAGLWSRFKRGAPGGNELKLEKMRLGLMESFLRELLQENDFAKVQVLASRYIERNRRMSVEIMHEEPRTKSLEMATFTSSAHEHDPEEEFVNIDLGALHRVLSRYKPAALIKAEAEDLKSVKLCQT